MSAIPTPVFESLLKQLAVPDSASAQQTAIFHLLDRYNDTEIARLEQMQSLTDSEKQILSMRKHVVRHYVADRLHRR